MNKHFVLTSCLSAGLIFFALPAVAAPPIQTAAKVSFSRHSVTQADALFGNIATDAREAAVQADTLASLEHSDVVDWEMHAGHFIRLRNEVNEMGKGLVNLEDMRSSVAPWQRKAIDRIAAALQLTVLNTEDAINFMNSNEQGLWNGTYRQYLDNLDSDANTLRKTVLNATQYANTLKHARELRSDLGLRAS